jgi:hypothetical protein
MGTQIPTDETDSHGLIHIVKEKAITRTLRISNANAKTQPHPVDDAVGAFN